MTDAVAVSIISTIGVVLAAMIQNLAKRVDGRLTELLKITRKDAKAEGNLEGVAQEKDRVK
jgi:hypothetical protein